MIIFVSLPLQNVNFSMKPKIYAVVDIETTGGLARRDRITEIAIVLYDGQKSLTNLNHSSILKDQYPLKSPG